MEKKAPPKPEDRDIMPIPFFRSWKRVYFFVIGFLLLEIVLLYLFTVQYQ